MSESGATARTPRRVWLTWVLALAIPLGIYFTLATRLILARVGYQYDEALYVESAVFVLHGSGEPPFAHDDAAWISLAGNKWPLMIIPYVGSLKAFVALPLFAVFGVNAETARFAGVLLASLGIAGIVVLIGSEVGLAAGVLTGAFLAIHPSYLDFTVFDNGGVSVWMGAMGLAALALTNHLRRRSAFSALLLGAALGVGVWARANVVWLAASVIVGALVVYGRRAVPSRTQVAALAIGGVCGALPLLLYQAQSRFGTIRFAADAQGQLSWELFARRLEQLAELMVSDFEQRTIWGAAPLPPWQMGVGTVLLAAIVLGVFLPVRSDATTGRFRRAFALAAVTLALMMVASRHAVGQHHLVAVLPLGVASLVILGFERARSGHRASVLLAAVGAGLAVLWLGWFVRIDAGLRRTGGRRSFSSALYDVTSYLESHRVPPERLKIVDWGFQNSLYVLSAGSVYGTELFWSASPELSGRGNPWRSEIEEGGAFLMFRYKAESEALPAVKGFTEALERSGRPRRETLFFDRSGSTVAALVEIPPAGRD